MPNCAIHIIGSDEISHFVRDCVHRGNSYVGTNVKLHGIKPRHWAVRWTNDDVEPVLDGAGATIGWSKRVSELAEAADPAEIGSVTQAEYEVAVRLSRFVAGKSRAQVERYVDESVTDLASARDVLKKLAVAVWALSRMVDYEQ